MTVINEQYSTEQFW